MPFYNYFFFLKETYGWLRLSIFLLEHVFYLDFQDSTHRHQSCPGLCHYILGLYAILLAKSDINILDKTINLSGFSISYLYNKDVGSLKSSFPPKKVYNLLAHQSILPFDSSLNTTFPMPQGTHNSKWFPTSLLTICLTTYLPLHPKWPNSSACSGFPSWCVSHMTFLYIHHTQTLFPSGPMDLTRQVVGRKWYK